MLSFLRDFAVEKLGHLEANFILDGGNSDIFMFNLSWGDFAPLLGEMIHFDKHIFRMGWNHQVLLMEEILHHLGCTRPRK